MGELGGWSVRQWGSSLDGGGWRWWREAASGGGGARWSRVGVIEVAVLVEERRARHERREAQSLDRESVFLFFVLPCLLFQGASQYVKVLVNFSKGDLYFS